MPDTSPVPETESFGGYRAVRKLGQGASSAVFEGLRHDADFTQRVAIKALLDGRAASLSAGETRILARLEHPNIARLLDAGSTRSGVRFLITEFVDGVPCTEYADSRRLDETARLRLFLQICDAVQYANRSLVIHCDLKPANVLVSHTGAVKLLDFGISRLLSESVPADRQAHTHSYSPQYASPEQILGHPLTVATDVYSLGALLCELAGGRPPRSGDSSRPEELARAAEEELTGLPLSGDIERIAAKALRAAPSLRYASVADLAADVKRYLDGRPVEARPLSHLYRFRKFADRHRLAVAATALVAALLIAGTVFALRQRGLAEQRFAQIRALANSVLFEIHDEIFKLPGSLDARHLLASRGVQYLDALAASAGTDSALQLEAARGFVRLADIEGVSNEPSLGQSSRAMRRIERAGQMVRAVLDRAPHDYEALSAHYVVLEALSSVYSLHGDARAIPTAEELLRVSETLAAARPNDGKVKEELAHALFVVANTYTQSRTHGSRGVDAWRRAVAAWKALYEEKPDSLDRKRELARSYQFLAGALSRAVKREEARETALLAYGMHKELALIDDEEIDHMLAADVGLLANLSAQLKRYADAVPLFQEQLRLREKLAAKDPNNLNALMGIAGTMDRIGLAYLRLNRPEEGLSFLERSLEQQRAVLAKDPDNVLVNREMLYVLTDLTEANEALKRRDRMCRYANETTVILKGPIARTRETPTDAAKKQYVKKVLAACASSAGD